MLPADRRKRILELLAERGIVRIGELSRALGVSAMTVHRDLDRLAAEGRLRKVRGGAVPVESRPASDEECPVCHSRPPARTLMVLHLTDGTHRRTCCPHCGLLAVAELRTRVVSAVVADFLSGQMINARVASYVVAPEISLCCTPTVLAFQKRADAQRFQRGFGGKVLGLEGAIQYLQREMSLATR